MGEKRLTPVARKLRHDMTDAERRLWSRIRNRQLENIKFVRQFPVGPYIADFAARQLKLIIELDGGQHGENKLDAVRTTLIEAHGYHIIRFWNHNVIGNIDGVLEMIAQEIQTARGQ